VNWIEWTAAILSAVSVYLSARENIGAWPTSIAGVALYAYVFFHQGLYSSAGLQLVFLGLSIYGWYQWLYGGERHSRLRVTRSSARVWLVCAVGGLAFWWMLARLTSLLPGVALSTLDSGLATLSVLAQWMLTRKILENWILWIVADLVYVPMFLSQKLYPTAALYVVLLVLATMGYVQWRRSYARNRGAVAVEPAPA
jgi:nicotinamide mononucleotide transporter